MMRNDIVSQFIQRVREDGYAVIAIPIKLTDELSDDEIKTTLITDILKIVWSTNNTVVLCALEVNESLIIDDIGPYEVIIRPILKNDKEAQHVD